MWDRVKMREKESTPTAAIIQPVQHTNWLGELLLFLYAWPNSIQFKSLFTNTYLWRCAVYAQLLSRSRARAPIIVVNLYRITLEIFDYVHVWSLNNFTSVSIEWFQFCFGQSSLNKFNKMESSAFYGAYICKCSTTSETFFSCSFIVVLTSEQLNNGPNRIESLSSSNCWCFQSNSKKVKKKLPNDEVAHYESWSLNLPWTNLIIEKKSRQM